MRTWAVVFFLLTGCVWHTHSAHTVHIQNEFARRNSPINKNAFSHCWTAVDKLSWATFDRKNKKKLKRKLKTRADFNRIARRNYGKISFVSLSYSCTPAISPFYCFASLPFYMPIYVCIKLWLMHFGLLDFWFNFFSGRFYRVYVYALANDYPFGWKKSRETAIIHEFSFCFGHRQNCADCGVRTLYACEWTVFSREKWQWKTLTARDQECTLHNSWNMQKFPSIPIWNKKDVEEAHHRNRAKGIIRY